jgi:hypothetical protein
MSAIPLPNPPPARKNQLLSLKDRHREMLRLSMLGLNVNEIAEKVDMTTASVSHCLNSEIGREVRNELNDSMDVDTIDVKEAMHSLTPRAVHILARTMSDREQNASLALKVKVAESLLDRTGHGKVQTIKGEIRHGYIQKMGVENLKKRGIAAGVIDATPVDAEFAVVDASSPEGDSAPTPALSEVDADG